LAPILENEVSLPCALNLIGSILAGATDYSLWPAGAEFIGPTEPGQRVDVSIVLGRPLPVILADVYGPGGVQLSEDLIRISVGIKQFNTGQRWVKLDAFEREQEAFRIPLPYCKELENLQPKIQQEENAFEYVVDLPLPQVPGELNLGQVVLMTCRLLATGRIVDSAGMGLPGASLRVKSVDDLLEQGALPINRRLGSDPDGSFRINSNQGGVFDLTASCPGFAPLNKRVELPNPFPIEFLLPRAESVEARILIDKEEWLSLVFVEVRNEQQTRTSELGGARFRIDGFLPGNGPFVVDVRSQKLDWLIQSFSLGAGKQISELDLREAFQVWRAIFQDQAGVPLSNRNVSFEADGESSIVRLDSLGAVTLAIPMGIHELNVSLNQGRPLKLTVERNASVPLDPIVLK